MKNKVILLSQNTPITGHHTSDATLIGTVSIEYDENEKENVVSNIGMFGGEENILLYKKDLRREQLSLLLQKNIHKKTVHGTLDYERKANVIVEVELIQPDTMDILVRRSQIIKSDKGLEFHFGLDEDAKDEFPDIVPCPFCGHAAHWLAPDESYNVIKEHGDEFLKDKESGYYTTQRHLKCDSCGEIMIWETEVTKGEDIEPR